MLVFVTWGLILLTPSFFRINPESRDFVRSLMMMCIQTDQTFLESLKLTTKTFLFWKVLSVGVILNTIGVASYFLFFRWSNETNRQYWTIPFADLKVMIAGWWPKLFSWEESSLPIATSPCPPQPVKLFPFVNSQCPPPQAAPPSHPVGASRTL